MLKWLVLIDCLLSLENIFKFIIQVADVYTFSFI